MLILLRVILYCIGIPALIIIIALCLALSTSNQHISIPRWELTSDDIERAKAILYANQQATDDIVSLALTERDLNIACAYLLNLFTNSQSHIQLNQDSLDFQLRFTLPDNLFGRYIDIQFQLYIPAYRYPEVKKLQIGKITVADIYAGFLVEYVIRHSRLNQYLNLIIQNLREIQLHPQELQIKYQLPASAINRIQQLLSPKIDEHALAQYQSILDQTLHQHKPTHLLSLSDILQPLFQLAQQRSTPANAIDENRLLIYIANRYINHPPPVEKNGPSLPRYPVFMYRRTDMAQHFMWSAALASSGSAHLAHTIGTDKELNDAKRGSGFSFIDLAADRAGAAFGKQATASPADALATQQKMAKITHYQAFMPDIRHLPENLTTNIFEERFHSIYSPEYQSLLQYIDQRIAQSELYQLTLKCPPKEPSIPCPVTNDMLIP